MIVVEGPDGSGKTTLIAQLVEATGLPIAPRVVSKDAEALTDLVRWTEENVKKGFQATIFDRHRLFSEPIYGPILRDSIRPEFADREWFMDWLEAFYDCDPIVIYCLPPLETVMANVCDDPDNTVVAQPYTTQLVWGAYMNKAITEVALRPSTVIYDYTDAYDQQTTLPRIINTVKERIAHV